MKDFQWPIRARRECSPTLRSSDDVLGFAPPHHKLQPVHWSRRMQPGEKWGNGGVPAAGSAAPAVLATPTPPLPCPILPLPQPDLKAFRSIGSPRRPRSEKKPIPEEQKDERYYERRKRNNQAAKKSRDARRLREDQIALRASMLEHENAILRAQVITLREEAQSLRELLLHQKKYEALDVCTI